jgi:hypothetical protein
LRGKPIFASLPEWNGEAGRESLDYFRDRFGSRACRLVLPVRVRRIELGAVGARLSRSFALEIGERGVAELGQQGDR